ncbi:bi-domain-containing oxidoreductase [Candidatus Electrothrix sp.]|uniref:bi-domain-containing oxidoreductase n=1 Tax=Candidatus Electrothrix sp. TaxID=2170559 RepID=UPI00405756BD
MKQILQNMFSGETRLVTIPVPKTPKTGVLIKSSSSLISIGTERMLVEFGKANMLDKARQQPEKVKMVLEKVKTDGLATTIDAVRSKLDQPLPLGYCNVGIVLETGAEVYGLKAGDRVVSNGSHAEMVAVSQNLCARIPDTVSDETAAFTVLGSIGLEGIRLAAPTLGEYFVVTGLGLIGLLTVQLLRTHGCRVLGIDFDPAKLELARQFGVETVDLAQGEDPVEAGMAFSKGRGVDGVLITASTKSSDPVSQAARMSRQRGRIILVGVTGLELNRADFYEKELSFQVSCSYGPGRYDSSYEDQGRDYPFGYVRWTEQRNFEAVLDMMAEGRLDIQPLISHRFSFSDAVAAYQVLSDDRHAFGILLEYRNVEQKGDAAATRVTLNKKVNFTAESPICGFIGAGNYASRILIPAFVKAGAQLHTIVSSGGVSAAHHGEKNGFQQAATDVEAVFADHEINTVVIVTRHNTHARYVIKALEAGKHVFVEKPLCLTLEELDTIKECFVSLQKDFASPPQVMVGFNRRFAPQIVKIKELLAPVKQPKVFIMTMNAGAIPADTWIQDKAVGGGRIIGEACHYIDLMRYLAGSEIISVQARRMGDHPTLEVTEDKAAITLGFADGSFGTIHYLANGGKAFPKERIEVFAGDAVLQLDNFRKLKGYGWQGFKKMNLMWQDKGQGACAAAFLESIAQGTAMPIPFEELIEVARVSIEADEQLRQQG